MKLMSTIYGACSISAGLFWAEFVSDAVAGAVAGPAAPTKLSVASSMSSSAGGTGQKEKPPKRLIPVPTPISTKFFGINAWLPDKIGIVSRGGDLEKYLCGSGYNNPGDTCDPSEIFESGVKTMRYGGSGIETDYHEPESRAQYAEMVRIMRINGIEPVLQIPYDDGNIPTGTAAALVRYLNKELGLNVKTVSVGNEPDEKYLVNNTAEKIAIYFRQISREIKAVDPTIIVTGPDLSEYDTSIMEPLTTPGGPHDITGSYVAPGQKGKRYYVDILNFHRYRFNGIDANNPGQIGYTRDEVIAEPRGGYQEKLFFLKTRVDACNTAHRRTGLSALTMAVTETNITHNNPLSADLAAAGVDEWGSVGATSFLAGQYWAEVMSVGMENALQFMTFWSVKEGSNLGYIKSDSTGTDDGRKLSTYYHFQMMARNFRGVYARGTDSISGADVPEVKAFGSKGGNQIVVMILNQTTSADYDYTVRLESGVIPGGGNPLKINIDAGKAVDYNSSDPLKRESTVMLVFNEAGALLQKNVYSVEHARGDDPPTVYRCPPC